MSSKWQPDKFEWSRPSKENVRSQQIIVGIGEWRLRKHRGYAPKLEIARLQWIGLVFEWTVKAVQANESTIRCNTQLLERICSSASCERLRGMWAEELAALRQEQCLQCLVPLEICEIHVSRESQQ